jgi:integrase
MAQGINRLTAVAIKGAKPGATLNDGGGLTLRVSASGGGRWSLRFKMRGEKQREMGLGAFPVVTLASARQRAAAARTALAGGLDPIIEAEREAAAKRQLEQMHAKQADQWKSTFTKHAAPLRDLPLPDLTRDDVLAVLRPIWDKTHDTARRVRGRLEALFAHAIQNGVYLGDNPAAWRQFDFTLSPQRKLTHGHRRALPHDEVADFIAALRPRQGEAGTALMLEFIALAACRMGEARLAVWGEIDPTRAVWSIPPARMKMRRGHDMPLTVRMVEILDAARARFTAINGREPAPADLIFPTEKGKKPFSENAMMMLLKRMDYRDRMTTHGLRATFRTWAGECTAHPRELIEEQLAHQLKAVERAYVRGNAVERRRVMMEDWSGSLAGASPAGGRADVGKVVALRAVASGAS